jgi:hypothetical protein
MIEEAHGRLEKFRRKLSAPARWSDENWQKTCASLAQLTAEVPEPTDQQPSSPVADY